MPIKKFFHYYTIVAILFLNTVVLFLLLNLLILAGAHVRNAFRQKDNGYQKLYDVPLHRVYPGYSQDEIDRIVNETWVRGGLEYEPFTGIKERAFTSTYVNVSPEGYRLTVPQGPWPPDPKAFTIFLFGGSTTFNYGVADKDTTASYLQSALRAAFPGKPIWVYNFGRGFYYSSQELILFERLLVQKHRPDVAIFIDGLNDFAVGFDDTPSNADQLHRYVESVNFETAPKEEFKNLLKAIPLARLAEFVQAYGKTPIYRPAPRLSAAEEESKYGDRAVLRNVIDRYLENRKMIEGVARAYNIQPVFVIQPVPFYKYDLRHHIFYGSTDPNLQKDCANQNLCYVKYGYPLLASTLSARDDDTNLLWLADLQETERTSLYVDTVHYTAEMSDKIAKKIAAYLHERGVLADQVKLQH